ncbi:unnamed protein product (mitochondrion) [Plasmodiophora brassicae]|uniref:Uncharacterized protein n=1 Tax=Plasmodiophora brassicae TaxID=37360 RepID=A0A0G4IW55_PLABS|nr:hypothetical protein PBRA_007306 [Plasmodiophora brassicae]SPQ95928.1 unnamed protein product [Plasmodiophora brassicae]
MLASVASAVPVVDSAAKVKNRLDDLEKSNRSLRGDLGVHGETGNNSHYYEPERASPLVYHATSATRQAPSILAVGPLNTAKPSLVRKLLGAVKCDPPMSLGLASLRDQTPLTDSVVRCTTCFVNGDPLVNICGLAPGLFDTEFENEFWKHFMAAVNLVVEHAGPIIKVVYVDTFGGNVDRFGRNDGTDDDVKRGIYRARSINMLLTDAGYDDLLEVVVDYPDSFGRSQAGDRLFKTLRFNSDVSVHAASPITNLAGRLALIGDWGYDWLLAKALFKCRACTFGFGSTRCILTGIKLSSAVVDACRAQLGTLRGTRVDHQMQLTAQSTSTGDALRSQPDHLTRQTNVVARAGNGADQLRTIPFMASSGNCPDGRLDDDVQDETTHAGDGWGTTSTNVDIGAGATATNGGSIQRATMDSPARHASVLGNVLGDVFDANSDPDSSRVAPLSTGLVVDANSDPDSWPVVLLPNAFGVAGKPPSTAAGIVILALAVAGSVPYMLKRLTQKRVPVPAPASNTIHKIGMAAGIAAVAGGLIRIGANAVKGKHLMKSNGIVPDEDAWESSAALQVMPSVALTAACVLAAMA